MNRGPLDFSAEPAKKTGAQDDVLGHYRNDFPVPKRSGGDLLKALDGLTSNIESSVSAQSVAPRPLTDYSSDDRLRAEGSLLASIPSHIGTGIVESAKDAWEHKGRTSFETVSGLALGSVFCLLSKNPRPIITAATTWAGRAFLGVAALDLGGRFARPMADTWQHPERLEQDKKVLGYNLGDAVVNYSLAVAGGIAGAKLGESYLAKTKMGTILQGYKETEITAEALGRAVSEPATAGQPLGVMARAFDRSAASGGPSTAGAGGTSGTELPIKGSLRMREMPDGSHVGTTKDGNVMVLTRDGTALLFKNSHAGLFKDKLDLTKIFHQGGDETDILTGMYSPTTSGTFGLRGASGKSPFIGKDPSAYFDAPGAGGTGSFPGGGQAYVRSDATKFVTGHDGRITAIETDGNHLYTDQNGNWHLGLVEGNAAGFKPSTFFNLDLHPASFNLGGLTDRFRALKKGAEVGLTESLMARVGDIGSGVFEHEVLMRSSSGAQAGSEAKVNGENAP